MHPNKREFPTRAMLQEFAQEIPEMNVASVEIMLQILKASNEIQYHIYDILEKKYKLSEGKLMVMIIMYRSSEGISPSNLAERAGVTRATISAMLQRMIRDGLAFSYSDASDGRGKVVTLTEEGRSFMDEILPDHFLRTARLMDRFTQEEQVQLVKLLEKIKLE